MTRKKNETKIINHPSSKRAEGLYDDLGNKRKAMIQEKEKELKKAMSQAPRNEKLIQELATNLQALNAWMAYEKSLKKKKTTKVISLSPKEKRA